MSFADDFGGMCMCGAPSDACADFDEHVGPRRRMAEAHDREMGERARLEAYDQPAPRNYAAEDCDCTTRNALFASLRLAPGVCRPCTARASRGLPANDATIPVATSAAA